MAPGRLQARPEPGPGGRAELHVHLEGTVRWATARDLATRHGLTPPPPYDYSDLRGFLELYRAVNRCLVDSADFERVVLEHAEVAAAAGITYTELSFNPSLHGGRSWLNGLARGRVAAAERFGVEIAWLVELTREGSDEMNRAALQLALATEAVVGLGLVGDESIPAGRLAPLIARARERGLKFMPHAGQGRDGAPVREVLALGADRIAHGVASAGDGELLAELAERGVCLCVCPSSNRKIGLDPDYAALARAGVPLTANTDDPPMVGTDLDRELALLGEATGLSPSELVQNSWQYCF